MSVSNKLILKSKGKNGIYLGTQREFTAADKKNIDDNTKARHTHSNKSILDTITEKLLKSFEIKSNKASKITQDNINDDNYPSVKAVVDYVGEHGGTGSDSGAMELIGELPEQFDTVGDGLNALMGVQTQQGARIIALDERVIENDAASEKLDNKVDEINEDNKKSNTKYPTLFAVSSYLNNYVTYEYMESRMTSYVEGKIGDVETTLNNIIEKYGLGSDVFGYVDENNTVILKGNLAEDIYTIKYEMEDGSTVDIGNLILDDNVYYSVTNTLTNCTNNNNSTNVIKGSSYSAVISANSGYELSSVKVTMGGTDITSTAVSGGTISIASVTGKIVITAVAEEAVVEPSYVNLLKDYEVGKKLSISNSGATTNNSGACASGFIPLDNIFSVVRIANITISNSESVNNIAFYNSNKEFINGVSGPMGAFNEQVEEADGIYSFIAGKWITDTHDLAFFRFSCASITDDSIVTVNQEIV